MILPVDRPTDKVNEAEGQTLGAFAYYFLCEGQQQVRRDSATPRLPINLVQAGFEQVKRIPGVVKQNINVRGLQQPNVLQRRHQHAGDVGTLPARVRQAGPDAVRGGR